MHVSSQDSCFRARQPRAELPQSRVAYGLTTAHAGWKCSASVRRGQPALPSSALESGSAKTFSPARLLCAPMQLGPATHDAGTFRASRSHLGAAKDTHVRQWARIWNSAL